MLIHEAPAETIRSLRRCVLRPDRPPEETIYPGDDDPKSFHLSALEGDRLIGCATGMRDPLAGSDEPAYRLRGMAVHEAHRNRGIGGHLLEAFEGAAQARGVTLLWCNGRVSAAAFYRRHGWESRGEEFEIIGIPHLVFTKQLGSR